MQTPPRLEPGQPACLQRLVDAVDADFVAELFDDLFSDGADRIREMRRGVAAGDRAAHALRSMGLSLGFARLGALCGELEEVAPHGRPEEVEELVQRIESEFASASSQRSAWAGWLQAGDRSAYCKGETDLVCPPFFEQNHEGTRPNPT